MKAITLHKIWVISPQNRSDVSPEIAFLSLPELFNIACAFHTGTDMCTGRKTAGFCIWLCVTFPWSAALLSACILTDLGVVAE